ncbi:hypothetical protein L3Q82_007491 [Scortum barcoo]|uniref:Uncharacterized protein n=1 Tax=Scortum barcoo TaxID=214431 RepID=A0ACB8WNF3_9TELE|nr:hypothetical protein L3Q82_007491 [Scortum barcoo]
MKCFERLVKSFITSSILDSLDPLQFQFAYRPNRSTEDAIALTLHTALSHLDQRDTYDNNLQLNVSKTKELIVDFRRRQREEHAPSPSTGLRWRESSSFRFLGVHISEDLTWTHHTDFITKSARQRLFFLLQAAEAQHGLQGYSAASTGAPIERILTGCITAWYSSCTALNIVRLYRGRPWSRNSHTPGLSSTLCNWVLDFLTDRPQSVRIHDVSSSSISLSTGSPQGCCVLSPLLFTLLTHDCSAIHPSCLIVKFADDTAVVGRIANNDESNYRQEVEHLEVHMGESSPDFLPNDKDGGFWVESSVGLLEEDLCALLERKTNRFITPPLQPSFTHKSAGNSAQKSSQ